MRSLSASTRCVACSAVSPGGGSGSSAFELLDGVQRYRAGEVPRRLRLPGPGAQDGPIRGTGGRGAVPLRDVREP